MGYIAIGAAFDSDDSDDEVGMTEEAVRQARDAPDGSMAVANAAVQRLTDRTMRGEGHSYHDDDTPDANTAGAAGRASFKIMARSQLDDWLHRGDDPIVRDMNLYIYSMWVYRVEKHAYRLATGLESSNMDIEFDESYTARGTFIQRLSAEPRVPKLEGMQYVSEATAEVHYIHAAGHSAPPAALVGACCLNDSVGCPND